MINKSSSPKCRINIIQFYYSCYIEQFLSMYKEKRIKQFSIVIALAFLLYYKLSVSLLY